MPFPRSAVELQQFLCATNWMRDSLIDYARVARPLQDLLDDAMSRASKRTKRVAASVAIELSAIHREAFDEMKAMLSQSVILAHPKPGAQMCVLTDASDIGWSLLVTQVENWQPKLEVWEQAHEMLICLSGTFTGPQRN
ncbi:RNA-directed DNA polymerase [Phytophthora megakarya]|uniref:RNA-directed DNA polymerase n=1 Tax=Phytophthora megakarya TaxID=4795 RepID=A0A225V2C6_9STRA|nr:RNA-directed DNA polymerase [Phytophthora megakarya]